MEIIAHRKVGMIKMKVKDFMTTNIVWAEPNCTIHEVAKLMAEQHIGTVILCNTNKTLSGLITDRDIVLRVAANDKDLKTTQASDIMTTKLVTANPEDDAYKLMKCMTENQIRRVPVVQDNTVVGIVSISDLAKTENISSEDMGATVEHICGCSCNGNHKNAE